MVHAHGQDPCLRRRPEGGCGPKRLRVRSVYRWAWVPLRGRKAGRNGYSHFGREHQAPDHAHGGLHQHSADLHAFLCPDTCRSHGRNGSEQGATAAQGGDLWCRAVVPEYASAGGSQVRHRCHGHLRALGGHRSRSLSGVYRGQERAAHFRGPFHSGDHRSRNR